MNCLYCHSKCRVTTNGVDRWVTCNCGYRSEGRHSRSAAIARHKAIEKVLRLADSFRDCGYEVDDGLNKLDDAVDELRRLRGE